MDSYQSGVIAGISLTCGTLAAVIVVILLRIQFYIRVSVPKREMLRLFESRIAAWKADDRFAGIISIDLRSCGLIEFLISRWVISELRSRGYIVRACKADKPSEVVVEVSW